MPRKRSIIPRKLPQQDRSRLTVEAILEATTHILTEEGYDKANTNRIAERAGISIGSLYQYFPNKESLMAALMDQHSNEIAALVEAKLQNLFDVPPEVAIPELIRAVIAAHAIDPCLHQVLSEEIPRSERPQQMQTADERIAELLQAYLTRWRDRISPQNLDMTVFILSRTVESLCHSAVIEHPSFVSNSQFEQEVSNLLLLYLTGA
ncbi:TetR/AcrR family transcriptional regulator [Leptolyngbya sp. AN02str]|jgi:AcrR family transcriptional regulator|uniref:TetR/AcrR family transcriptional regulator n=1 Tax=Leptolyngbya sp. NK1-12 TaxID=2547451 RepID=A0AA96WLU9_9CYAN|nr:TetR/AcrR family transcriptional regulator [Leptolyngbya sp. NK1-12]WNZ28073.1 TetR/AcrR family transcriptional regulator [Leptolyngbya sp. NK1-12]